MTLVQGRMTIDKDAVFPGGDVEASSSDPDLLPLQEGAWLGKPSPGNPRKKRLCNFQKMGVHYVGDGKSAIYPFLAAYL